MIDGVSMKKLSANLYPSPTGPSSLALICASKIDDVHGMNVILRPDMSEQPIQDINDGKSWSEMDLFDLRNSLACGRPIEEVAGFLCRSGTVEEVKRKAEELGLLR